MTGTLLADFDPTHGARPEIGALIRQSSRALSRRSMAGLDAAENLLSKAMSSLFAGDVERMEHLVGRAARMPYDAREEMSPGVRAGTMLVYRLVSDAFDDCPYLDSTWLDVALEVHDRVDGPGKAQLASTLHGFVLQDMLFDVPASEARRIRQHVGDAPLEVDHGDSPDLSVEVRQEILRSLLATAVALRRAYAASARPTH